MDVSFVIAQQSVSFVVSQITNLGSYTTAMIVKFTGVSTTLQSDFFIGKNMSELIVQGAGGEWTTLNTGNEATLDSEPSVTGTITLSQDFGGTGIFKVIIA